ncbi:chitinase [Aspergillus sp. HF37]|nr:chitinase [Aspergillus sp. HF37]
MLSNTLFTAATAASLLTPFVAAFDAQVKTNVAVYYGQGANQKRLRHFCQETSMDIINLAFLNIFPDQGVNGYPETNFGNQCGSQTFDINGENTGLLSHCPYLIEDIPFCQAAGKKVLLSLGGASPDNQKIESEGSAKAFADFLWYAFGPPTDMWAENGLPRPFKDVVLDGFDFDIEHNGGFGYAIMANRLRDRFKEMPSRRFYLSAAPQCPIPDDQLSDAIANAPFDFIWVQFYNNPGCAAVNYVIGGQFNYDAWVDVVRKSANPSAKLFIGLPGSMGAVEEGWYYMPAPMVQPMVDEYMSRYPDTFGGIMVWDATASERNNFLEDSYAASMKDILLTCAPGPAPTPSSTSTTPTSSPTTSSSTTGVSSGSSSSPSSPTSESTTPASSGSSTPASPTTGTTTPASSGSSIPASPTTGTTTPANSESPSSPHSPTHSGSTTPSSSVSPSDTTLPSSTPGSSKPGPTGPVTTSGTSSFKVGRPSSSAGAISSSGITSAPSVKPTATSSPETTTTIIVTSYIDICPTGFTTITTTYTSTYCPATATPTVTNQPTGVPAQTTSPPEGWTKTVTVCTHCASTPTTVTLTLPTKTGTTGSPSGTVPAGGSGVSPVKSTTKSTTTTTVTSTLPCSPPAKPTTTPIIIPTPATSRPASSSGMRPSTAPSASPSRVPTSPSSSQGGVTPVYTGAAAKTGLQGGVTLCVALLLTALVFA